MADPFFGLVEHLDGLSLRELARCSRTHRVSTRRQFFLLRWARLFRGAVRRSLGWHIGGLAWTIAQGTDLTETTEEEVAYVRGNGH